MPRPTDTDSLLASAFGTLLPTLLAEAPERRAWTRLEPDAVRNAIRAAQARATDAAMKMGFRTLLKQQLDAACELAPAPMEFETSYMSAEEAQARPASRAWRDDRDEGRAIAPLKPARDATIIDTDRKTLAEVISAASNLVRERLGRRCQGG